MRKKVGIIKRVSCISLVFLLSINSFAAIVSDNDGSAFITKAEFDALKNDFQSQIDTYNQSIDAKIDGAIASYLSGISLTKTFKLESKLNICNAAGWYFDKDWTKTASGLGDKAKLRLAAAICLNRDASIATSTGTKTSETNTIWEIVWGSVNRDNPSFKTFGSTPDKYISYREDTAYPGKVIASSQIQSVPSVSVVYGKSHTAMSVSISNLTTMTAWTETKGSATSWGAFPVSHSFDPFGSSYAQSIGGVQSIINEDEMFTIGQGLPTTSFTDAKFYGLKIGKEHLIGDSWGTKSLADCGSNGQYVGGMQYTISAYSSSYVRTTSTNYSTTASSNNTQWKATLYRHKYDHDYYYRDINLQDISSAAGEFCTYGDGLPLFSSDQTGRVSFILDTGILNSQNFEIRAGKFNNTNINASPFATLPNANANITQLSTSATNTQWKIEFDAVKGTSYYIVCKPTVAGKCYVKTVGDIVLKVES